MKTLSVRFPAAGVTKKYGYQDQEPYSTADALNIWPYQSDTGRMRGGTRPGLSSFLSPGSGLHSAPAAWIDSSSDNYDSVVVTTSTAAKVLKNDAATGAFTSWVSVTAGSSLLASTCYFDKKTGYQIIVTITDSSSTLSGKIQYGELNGYTDLGDLDTHVDKVTTIPEDYKSIVTSGDRVWVGGQKGLENSVMACRIGAIYDWDTSAVDPGGAWITGGLGGVIDSPVRALVPHSRDITLICGYDRISVMIGNPKGGGQRDSVSQTVGVLGQNAFCKSPNGGTFFMSRDGLYYLPPGARNAPEKLSRKKMPSEFLNIHPESGDLCSIGYDTLNQGVHIYLYRGTTYSPWFYDDTNGGYWPMSLGSNKWLAVEVPGLADGDKTGLLAIGSSTHRYDSNNPDMGGGATPSPESITSYYLYGPIALSSDGSEGILTAVNAVLSEDSSSVDFEIYVGDSAQEAYDKYKDVKDSVPNAVADFTDTWDIKGYNYTRHPRLRGAAFYLKVGGTSSERISLETLEVEVYEHSKRRVG